MQIEQAIESVQQTVEGYRASRAVFEIAREHGVDLPIMDQIYYVLYQGKPLQQAVADLESRAQKPEIEPHLQS